MAALKSERAVRPRTSTSRRGQVDGQSVSGWRSPPVGPPGGSPDGEARDGPPHGTPELFESARPRASSPHLVFDNSSPDLQLSRVVELEIIPRLLMLHGFADGRPVRAAESGLVVGEENVRTLSRLLAEGDALSGGQYVLALLDAGAERESVLLDLLCPCARFLGEQWNADVYTFAEVTIAMWRLQRILDDQRGTPVPAPRDSGSRRSPRLLMCTVPGAQHSFGALVAAELFREQGWEVVCEPGATLAELQAQAAASFFDVIGMSVGADSQVRAAADAILRLRIASAHPSPLMVVGGPLASLHADLDERCGADMVSCSVQEVVDAVHRSTRRGVMNG